MTATFSLTLVASDRKPTKVNLSKKKFVKNMMEFLKNILFIKKTKTTKKWFYLFIW